MSYRPEGWENPCKKTADSIFKDGGQPEELGYIYLYHSKIFEAGADAMLEALRKITIEHNFRITWDEFEPLPKGRAIVLFIPDDKEG